MTVRLELEPTLEAELAAEAQSRGLALDRYVKEIVLTRPHTQKAVRKHPHTVSEAIERILQLRNDTDGAGLDTRSLITERPRL